MIAPRLDPPFGVSEATPLLTLWQPWATGIAIGAKRNETRGWTPPDAIVGEPVAIHAAKRTPTPVDRAIMSGLEHGAAQAIGHERQRQLVTGAIVAVAVPDDPWPTSLLQHDPTSLGRLTDRERKWGDYSPGRWAWPLTDVAIVCPSVPAAGGQKFTRRLGELAEVVADRLWRPIDPTSDPCAVCGDPLDAEHRRPAWADRPPHADPEGRPVHFGCLGRIERGLT